MAISKSQAWFESLWYSPKRWWLWLFYPLHLLLALVVAIRRLLYHLNIFKQYQCSVPVVVIGNINVGGTGKTPFAIYLLEKLKQLGYKPGLVTRGYGGDPSLQPLLVQENSNPSHVGDEPLLIYQRTRAPVMVDAKRARGAELLVAEHGCNIIICDDGLQHYALKRDIEVLIVDEQRQFGNEFLMPLGPLREPVSRTKECDITIINGKDMLLKADEIIALNSDNSEKFDPVKSLTAIAAIGNPQRFFNTLKQLGLTFKPQPFPDHHQFKVDDFTGIKGNIIITEKDAVKCREFADKRFFVLPVRTEIQSSKEQKLLALIKNLKIERKG